MVAQIEWSRRKSLEVPRKSKCQKIVTNTFDKNVASNYTEKISELNLESFETIYTCFAMLIIVTITGVILNSRCCLVHPCMLQQHQISEEH